jgi:hypothetical protein
MFLDPATIDAPILLEFRAADSFPPKFVKNSCQFFTRDDGFRAMITSR